jgi:choline dehydrogenase-like flavoprotein
MIIDFEDASSPTHFDADTVIIGAGAVGLSITADMVRRGKNVLVLEGGGQGLEQRSQDLFLNATSSGHVHEGLYSGRYRLLGGTTNFWGGQLVRFDPIVFEHRPWIENTAWPITHDALKPYYNRAMSLLGMDLAIADDADVWKRAKVEPPTLGNDLQYFFTRWTRVRNLAKLFQTEILNSRATIVLHANVTDFSAPHDDHGHVVHIRTFAGKEGTVSANNIILACGTFELVRLLLLPYRTGDPAPWNRNPWLGKGFIDHLGLSVGSVKVLDHDNFSLLFENIFFDGYKYNPKIKLKEESQRQQHLLDVSGTFIFRTSFKEHLENITIFLTSLKNGRWPSNCLDMPRHFCLLAKISIPLIYYYLKRNRMFHPSGSQIILKMTTEQVAIKSSEITLRPEKDALGMPQIDLKWSIAGRLEMETLARCAELIRDGMKSAGLAEITLDPRIAVRDPAILAEVDDTNHQMGGARMSHSPGYGVVDQNLKVFGSHNLYVAGAAVFPSSGFPNCTLTAIALGLRLVDHLEQSND